MPEEDCMSKKLKERKDPTPSEPRSINDPRLYEWEPRLISDKELYDSYERGDMPASSLFGESRAAYEAYLRKKKRFDLLEGEKSDGGGEAGAREALGAKKPAR
jgi:hypothetical protein